MARSTTKVTYYHAVTRARWQNASTTKRFSACGMVECVPGRRLGRFGDIAQLVVGMLSLRRLEEKQVWLVRFASNSERMFVLVVSVKSKHGAERKDRVKEKKGGIGRKGRE